MVTPLKLERIKKDMKQWDLARLVKIAPTDLSKYECGRMRCPADIRHRIANALDVPVDILFPKEDGER